MKKIFKFLVALLLLLTVAQAEKLVVLTENNFPPYNYMEDGEIRGISYEIVKEILKRAEIDSEIKMVDWEKGYKLIQESSNVALFSTIRSKKREKLFKWVGPIGSIEMVFLAKKSFEKKLSSIEDIKSLKKIGLQVESDYSSEALKERGFENLSYSGVNSLNALYLYTAKIDLWLGTEYQMRSHIKKLKLNPDDFKVAYRAKELGLDSDLYIALSKGIDKKIELKMQEVLDEMKKDGIIKEIVKKYY